LLFYKREEEKEQMNQIIMVSLKKKLD